MHGDRLEGGQARTRIIVPHMEWHADRFIPRRPNPLPSIRIKTEIIQGAHEEFSRPIAQDKCARVSRHEGIVAFADSGAQTCACGFDVLHELGLNERDLIPTSHRILGVTMTSMDIAGVFLAKISTGTTYTRQVVYVSKTLKVSTCHAQHCENLVHYSQRFHSQPHHAHNLAE